MPELLLKGDDSFCLNSFYVANSVLCRLRSGGKVRHWDTQHTRHDINYFFATTDKFIWYPIHEYGNYLQSEYKDHTTSQLEMNHRVLRIVVISLATLWQIICNNQGRLQGVTKEKKTLIAVTWCHKNKWYL